MAHNFRLSGNIYVSKAPNANDANDGLTPDNPKATINAAVAALSANNQIIVIGAGMYEEAMTRAIALTGITISGDGLVKLRGNGANIFGVTAGSQSFTLNNIIFENYSTVRLSSASVINNCDFISIGQILAVTSAGTHAGNFYYCKFINSPFFYNNAAGAVGGYYLNYCITINGGGYFGKALNCYFNAAADYRITANALPENHNYNNIMGTVYVSTTSYASLSAQQAGNPTFNANSFNLSPKFNNPAKYDFTLQYDSPHIKASSTGLENIGGTNYAVMSTFIDSPEWINGIKTDIELSAQDAVIAQGKTTGTLTSAPWKAFGNPQEILLMQYNGLLLFNKNAIGGTASNNNVPDSNVYKSDDTTGGNNPDRLSIEMRWSNNDEMPAQDTDWTNGGYGTPGTYYRFEINTQPKLYFNAMNNMYYGTGSVSYKPNTAFTFPVMWVQFRIILTNNYTN